MILNIENEFLKEATPNLFSSFFFPPGILFILFLTRKPSCWNPTQILLPGSFLLSPLTYIKHEACQLFRIPGN